MVKVVIRIEQHLAGRRSGLRIDGDPMGIIAMVDQNLVMFAVLCGKDTRRGFPFEDAVIFDWHRIIVSVQ